MNYLYWAKVKEDAVVPNKLPENAGYDLYPCFEEKEIFIKPYEIKMIPTGIASVFDKEYVGLVQERGSTGIIGMSKRAGVIDSGFRNEWQVMINNTSDKTIIITKDPHFYSTNLFYKDEYVIYSYNKAIAQVCFLPIAQFDSVEVISYDELKKVPSVRGMDMLGSTNAKSND